MAPPFPTGLLMCELGGGDLEWKILVLCVNIIDMGQNLASLLGTSYVWSLIVGAKFETRLASVICGSVAKLGEVIPGW